MRGRPAEEPIPEDPQSPFQFSRMLFSQLGLSSWINEVKCNYWRNATNRDKLLRELKNLDSQVKSSKIDQIDNNIFIWLCLVLFCL
jgi:hypothetical protein